MPAESAPHELCLMAWPCRRELWGAELNAAKEAYATVARAIAGPGSEPVLMVAAPGDGEEARDSCGSDGIEVIEEPIDDSWLRDSGPIYVLGAGGARAGVDFVFNAWGEKFAPWDRDAAIAQRLLARLGHERIAVPLVLEGGAICADGAGMLLTTEQCLLHPSRNPSFSREQIESALCEALGAERVLWLGQGLVEDRDTDGHVDLIAAFTSPGRVLLQRVDDRADPNWERMSENARRLAEAGVAVIENPHLPRARIAGEDVAVSHMNFYLANEAVVVPVLDADDDAKALELIGDAFGDRELVPVPGAVLAYGGGGPHCITQQVPSPAA